MNDTRKTPEPEKKGMSAQEAREVLVRVLAQQLESQPAPKPPSDPE